MNETNVNFTEAKSWKVEKRDPGLPNARFFSTLIFTDFKRHLKTAQKTFVRALFVPQPKNQLKSIKSTIFTIKNLYMYYSLFQKKLGALTYSFAVKTLTPNPTVRWELHARFCKPLLREFTCKTLLIRVATCNKSN
jgi:hypothetical protein